MKTFRTVSRESIPSLDKAFRYNEEYLEAKKSPLYAEVVRRVYKVTFQVEHDCNCPHCEEDFDTKVKYFYDIEEAKEFVEEINKNNEHYYWQTEEAVISEDVYYESALIPQSSDLGPLFEDKEVV